jgi:hypothetical protein
LAKSFSAMKAYGRSKLCNILFTRELARRLRGTGVTANCLHPGFVATRFADESGGLISRFAGLAKLLEISPEKGAETISYLASSPAIAATTGRYFYKCRPIAPSREAQNSRTALRGRIVFDQSRDLFIIYADRKLLTRATIARIATQFHLPAERTETQRDWHYQSTETPNGLGK